MAAPSAQAADAAASPRVAAATRPPADSPLKPGRTAGVKGAQQARTGLALIGAGAIIAVVVVAAGTSGGGSGGSQPNIQFAPATTSP
ncbi:MAG: hypothetical protein ABI608_03645 [Rhizomicrobium sp.]